MEDLMNDGQKTSGNGKIGVNLHGSKASGNSKKGGKQKIIELKKLGGQQNIDQLLLR